MNYLIVNSRIKNLTLLVSIFLTFTLRAQDKGSTIRFDSLILPSKKYCFHNCSYSKVPVFNMPTNSILELEIKTDFQTLFKTQESEQSRIKGTLIYTVDGRKVDLPIKIKARGKTRFDFCQYKPLDIKFSTSIKSTIFEGLVKKLYITTHCGNMNGEQWILKGTQSEHRNRLLAEYYMYSILETFGTVAHSVSLCKIKYINQEDSVLGNEYAFIVESVEGIAQRCNLIKSKKKVHYLDASSVINTELINQFIANYDWEYMYTDSTGWTGHNIKFLKSKDNIGYLLPYDFDLNAITFPEYSKNIGKSFDEQCYLFQEILNNNFTDKKKLEAVYKIYIQIPSIKSMIECSYMDDVYKQKFKYLIESYEFILYNHLVKYREYKKQLK